MRIGLENSSVPCIIERWYDLWASLVGNWLYQSLSRLAGLTEGVFNTCFNWINHHWRKSFHWICSRVLVEQHLQTIFNHVNRQEWPLYPFFLRTLGCNMFARIPGTSVVACTGDTVVLGLREESQHSTWASPIHHVCIQSLSESSTRWVAMGVCWWSSTEMSVFGSMVFRIEGGEEVLILSHRKWSTAVELVNKPACLCSQAVHDKFRAASVSKCGFCCCPTKNGIILQRFAVRIGFETMKHFEWNIIMGQLYRWFEQFYTINFNQRIIKFLEYFEMLVRSITLTWMLSWKDGPIGWWTVYFWIL